MTNAPAHMLDRSAVYRQLGARNRRIGRLRWGVPLAGALVLALLLAQIYIANLGGQLQLAGLSIDRNNAVIEAPEYAGVLSDGTAYRVAAGQARASLSASHEITLDNTSVMLTNPNGTQTKAEANEALLDTNTQEVLVTGVSNVESSDGTLGQFVHTLIDWREQTFTSTGGARILFDDGTSIIADGAVYDLEEGQWTFSRAKVVLPSTPGEDKAEDEEVMP